MSKVKFDNKNLKKLIENLKKTPVAQVGVLASKNSRNDENSNASIGFKHEFGIDVPKRSFIRQPLIDQYQKFLEKAGFNMEKVAEALVEDGLEQLVAKMGIVGVEVIHEGFNSGGFGKWAPHAKGYTNNTGMILVDTQQLRNSIISQVKK